MVYVLFIVISHFKESNSLIGETDSYVPENVPEKPSNVQCDDQPSTTVDPNGGQPLAHKTSGIVVFFICQLILQFIGS